MPRAKPNFKKRTKYNLIVCDISGTPTGGAWESGAYIKVDQFYAELFISDTDEFWYETNGDSKIISFNNMPNIFMYRIYVSEDKQTIVTFSSALDVESKCFEKILKALKLIEPLQTTEDTGVENAYTTEDTGIELAYCYKEFVTEVK